MNRILLILIAILFCSPAFSQNQGAPVSVQCVTGGSPPNTNCNPSQPFIISGTTNIPTYSAADAGIANTGAGDILCISGSATKTVYVKRFRASAVATSAIVVDTSIIKRSSAATGGTPVAETATPHDSRNAAATAVVTGYTVSPTPGTAVGATRARHLAIGVQGNTSQSDESLFDFFGHYDQPIVLRGTSQFACLNVGAAGSGGSWAADVEWTEGN